MKRRDFLKLSGTMAATALVSSDATAGAAHPPEVSADAYGCLVDTTLCVGCRKCEEACNERHGLAKPELPFNEPVVLEKERRPDETSYTIVNKYYPRKVGTLTWRENPTFVKFQCMHCNDPSCVSACIVGALTKQPEGPVIYDADKCIGCRYCMVACPFQIPAYEYHNALTPKVQKCTFCFEHLEKGGLPACAQICPMEVMTFGKKSDLLNLAKSRIKAEPGKYVDHVYGEYEVGGTSWIYIASEPFETIGFPKLGVKAPPRLTESIQHGLSQYFAAPIALFTVLGTIMGLSNFYKNGKDSKEGDEKNHGE